MRLENTVFQIREVCSRLDAEAFPLPHELGAAEIDEALATLRGSLTELKAFIARLAKAQIAGASGRTAQQEIPIEEMRATYAAMEKADVPMELAREKLKAAPPDSAPSNDDDSIPEFLRRSPETTP